MKFYSIPPEMESCVWEVFKITIAIVAAITAAIIEERLGRDWHSQVFYFILVGFGLYTAFFMIEKKE